MSIDAAGCQKNLAKELVEVRGADYLFAPKGNQGNTLGDVKLLMEDLLANEPQRLCRHEEWNKEHGRIERRTCYTTNWVDWGHRGASALRQGRGLRGGSLPGPDGALGDEPLHDAACGARQPWVPRTATLTCARARGYDCGSSDPTRWSP